MGKPACANVLSMQQKHSRDTGEWRCVQHERTLEFAVVLATGPRWLLEDVTI